MTMTTPAFKNLTTLAQQRLGIQQAQTITAETIASDAIARLHGRRGDVQRLVDLWQRPEADLVGTAALLTGAPERIRGLLGGLTVARSRLGTPHTFLPYTPELITDRNVSQIFRDMGATVVDALWGGVDSELAAGIREVTGGWSFHPLARVFAALCVARPIPSPRGATESRSYLRALFDETTASPLASWARGTVTEDWTAWVAASSGMSIDEQLQTFSVLIGLHLHVALQWRLAPSGARPLSFCVTPDAAAGPLVTASCNVYQWWQGRTLAVLQAMSLEQVDAVADENPDLSAALDANDAAVLSRWRLVRVESARQKSADLFHQRYQDELTRRTDAAQTHQMQQSRNDAREIVRDALLHPFAPSAEKFRDYLRQTGRAAAYVGPDRGYSRKRYQIDARLLGLLARLHTSRDEMKIRTSEEERYSIEGFLDDIFDRYGILITRGREAAEAALATESMKPLLRFLPNEALTEANRHDVEQLLEGLRLLRRYSDDSAVLVPMR